MTFHIIMSRPEYITYLGGNKNDKDRGIINKHSLSAHPFVSPPIASNDLEGSPTGSGLWIRWRPPVPRN